MFSKLFIVMTALAAVNAQSSASAPATTSVPSIDPCILACIEPAATQNGCAYTDVSCVCTSAQFQADAGACLVQHCTSSDLAAAMALQGAECAALSLSVTATASVTPKPVSFSLASSGTASGTATSGATTPTITTPTASTSPTTATTPTGTSTGTTPAAPVATTAKSAASSLVANSGVGALVAIIAGFLAL